jgi:hypothetical protein
LIIHQALYFEEMEHVLLCPMQLRLNQVIINEQPKFLSMNPSVHDNSVFINEEFLIPLAISGINSVFPFRTPSESEMAHAKRFELKSPEPECDPHSNHYQEEEEKAMLLLDGYQYIYNRNLFVSAMSATDYSPFQLCHHEQDTILIAGLDVDSIEEHPQVSAIMTEKSTYVLTPEKLSKTWGIGLPAAKRTLLGTTQRGVRSTLYPNI